MPVWLRRSLIAVAVLAALLVAALAWLVASFDPNRYKGLLIDWMRDTHQRTLAIDGPIGLGVFPRLELTLRDVKLSEHRRPDAFVSLQEATLAVQVLPLLRQQLAIDRVAARGVRVVYTRDAAGKRNIDDLLQPSADAAAQKPKTADGTPALRFDVSSVEFEDLQATVVDVPLGLDGRFVVKQLRTGRLADGAESPLQFVGQAQLTKPALNAEVDLSGRMALKLPAGAPASVAFDDLKLALRGEGFQVRGLDAQLAGRLAYDGASGALQADGLKLQLSGQRLGVSLKDSRIALATLRYEPAKRALKLAALELQIAGRSADQAIAATLNWPQLDVSGDTLKGSALKGSATLTGEGAGAQSVQLQFESQAPSGSFERIRVPGLKVAVDGGGAGRTVRGTLGSDLTLALQPLNAALDALNLKLAFTDPTLPPLNLALTGQAQAGAKDARWSFDGALNDQKFSASGRADLARQPLRVEVQARFAALDLTRFVKPGAAAPAAPKPAGADTPVDLAGLKALDGQFLLRAGNLVYPPYRVADAALDATLAGGVLRVSQLSGRAWGGSFQAQGSADANKQTVGLKLDATEVDIAALLSDVAQFKKLEGRGRVNADVTTRGTSVNQFKQALGGRAAFQLRDGAVRGINLAKTLRQWRSAVTLNKDAVQSASAEERTDFSEISASFDIANGVARSRDLSAKSPFLRVGGEGLVDIGKGRVDYLARATVTGTSKGQDGADLAALQGVTVPVQLVGPFDAVDYKVQWSAVAADLVGKRVEDAAKKAVTDKLGGALGGLLGGKAPAGGASAPAGAASKPKDALKESLKGLFGR